MVSLLQEWNQIFRSPLQMDSLGLFKIYPLVKFLSDLFGLAFYDQKSLSILLGEVALVPNLILVCVLELHTSLFLHSANR